MFAALPPFVALAAAPALAVIGLALIGLALRRTRGSTLQAPLAWAATSMIGIVVVETGLAILNIADSAGAAQLRLAAGSTALLPAVALFGAKRPQNGAWQFVVFSCWVLLAMPAGQAWLMRPDYPPAAHPLWIAMVLVIVAAGAVNYLPTKFWPTALLWSAGQIAALWESMPWSEPGASLTPAIVVGLFTAAAVIAALLSHRCHPSDDSRLDELWIDFRNQFGVVWALRVAERVNASLKSPGQDAVLTWHGFTTSHGGTTTTATALASSEAETTLCAILRRFVSAEWIDARLGERHTGPKR